MVSRGTREWSTLLLLRGGLQAVVIGAQTPGGRVVVRYPATHEEIVAADPGDYVYPSDVRVDTESDFLYIKAEGVGVGLTHETWLFAYDLHRKRIADRRLIRNGVLPGECPELSAGP